MEATALPPDAPLWRRHVHPEGFGYGWLLGLILFTIGFQLGAPEADWARLVTIVLQGVTLLAALHVSGAHRWLVRVAWVVTGLAVLGAAGLVATSGAFDTVAARVLGLTLVVLAPPAIIAGVVRQARASGAITVRTMFGVLCVYLLLGSAFALAYGVISAADNDTFFAQHIANGPTQSDFLYFSFVTMTTTGYGDLTAATNLGRSLSITEALIGQIYLVTVVALIVSNLGARRGKRRI